MLTYFSGYFIVAGLFYVTDKLDKVIVPEVQEN